MKTFTIICFVAMSFILSASVSVAEGVWTRYEGIGKVVSIASEGNFIWCGTMGTGVYSLNKLNGMYLNYSTSDGLVNNTVLSIAIDKNGLKWFGTAKGISVYDGKNWRSYMNDESIRGNRIYSILVDEDNTKYIGTGDGIAKFGKDDAYLGDDSMGLIGKRRINSMAMDRNGVVWCATSSGILSCDGGVWRENTKSSSHGGVASSDVYSIAIDKDCVKWLSVSWSYFDVIYSFDDAVWKQYSSLNLKDGPPQCYIFSAAVDKNNVKWFGTEMGVCRYDDIAWKVYSTEDGLSGNRVNSVIVDSDNIKWFGTDDGITSYCDDVPTSVETEKNSPASFSVLGNFPNPFNPSTTIKFSVNSQNTVSLSIFGISGQKVRTLVNDRFTVGNHSVLWDGKDETGNAVSSGIYFYRIMAGNLAETRKMMLVR